MERVSKMSGKNSLIGIACGCRKLNYGSILQSFALCTMIQKMGYQCEFIWVNNNTFKYYNIRPQKVLGVFRNVLLHPSLLPRVVRSVISIITKQSSTEFTIKSKEKFAEFKKDYLNINLYSYKDLKNDENKYKCFVCGSDQIWNSYEYYMDPMYFLRFTNINKRVAYAPSFGENDVSYYNKKIIQKYISEFKSLSVREKSGSDICKRLIDKDVDVVLDPTLLLTSKEWESVLNINDVEDEYCFVYFLSTPTDVALKAINEIRKRYKIKTVPYMFECYESDERVDAGPKEFIELIKNAKLILTDSFHGTIFSINFNKQFIAFDRNYNQGSNQSCRVTDIFDALQLRERFVTNENELSAVFDKKIEYVDVNQRLDDLREKSKKYLEDSLR